MTAAISDQVMKTEPDAENVPAIQQMLRHAYDWGIQNGYITFVDGVPVFNRKADGGRMKDVPQGDDKGAEVRA